MIFDRSLLSHFIFLNFIVIIILFYFFLTFIKCQRSGVIWPNMHHTCKKFVLMRPTEDLSNNVSSQLKVLRNKVGCLRSRKHVCVLLLFGVVYIYKYKYKNNSEQLLRLLSMSLHTRDAVSVERQIYPVLTTFCLKSLFLKPPKLFFKLSYSS